MIETNLVEDLRPLSPPSLGWLVWLVAVVVAALGAGWLLRRRTVRPPPRVAPMPAPDVWEATLRELERLLPLLRPDQSRAYGMASTALLRPYLECRFGIEAPLLATEEFLAAARRSPALPEAHRDALGEYLRLCDLLKFGRAVAETAELQQLHLAAVAFVSTSRPLNPVAGPATVPHTRGPAP